MEYSIESPCTNRCFVPPDSDICTGCFRTINEIINWIDYTDEQRSDKIAKIEQRKRDYERKNE